MDLFCSPIFLLNALQKETGTLDSAFWVRGDLKKSII